ncbi:MAG: heavy metal sensor histidine kinase [Gammaproteobacteria bacterium]
MTSASLTTRVSLLFAVSAAVVLLALGWVVARAVDAHFLEMDRHELDGKLALVRNLLARAEGPDALAAVRGQIDDALVGHHGLAVVLLDSVGRTWYASGHGVPQGLPQQPAPLVTWTAQGRTWRGLAAPVAAGAAPFTAALALDITHHQHFLDRFHVVLGVVTVLAMLAMAALGWLATRAGLRPLGRMAQLATRLSAAQLSERIPEDPLPAEIRTLATAFNAMLGRLEEAFRRLSEFSSDLAHELRTPVSNLMTQTQVALVHERSAAEYRDVLQSAMEEYERLARMIEDMLFIAKADNRQVVPRRDAVDLAKEVRELIEFHGLVAEERGISLRLEGAATVSGDRLMLRRALSNLLSNAIRHCPDSGAVWVRLRQDEEVELVVENPGDIAADKLPRLFDRFYTGDPARRSGAEGVGLGLAIVRSIVEAHGGHVSATAGEGVVRFVVRLPGGRGSREA